MPTTVADLEIYTGEDVTINGTAEDSGGTAIDLTDFTGTQITWRLAVAGSSTAAVEYTQGSGITITTAAAGTFAIAVAGADTDGLAAGAYRQYLLLTDGSDNTDVIWVGDVTVNKTPASPA